MRFALGDEVIATDGQYKGVYGTVLDYWIDSPVIQLADDQSHSGVVVVQEDQLALLVAEEPEPDPEGENVLDIPVHPDFGLSQEVYRKHVEYMIGRCLSLVGTVGVREAMFGFQEFEGKSATEILLELMMKLEEGMALFAQAHIMIGRTVTALEKTYDQI